MAVVLDRALNDIPFVCCAEIAKNLGTIGTLDSPTITDLKVVERKTRLWRNQYNARTDLTIQVGDSDPVTLSSFETMGDTEAIDYQAVETIIHNPAQKTSSTRISSKRYHC